MPYLLLLLSIIYGSILPDTRSMNPTTDPGEKALNEIIREIGSETGYRILYRDALVAGKRAVFTFDEQWETKFQKLLESHDLDSRIDTGRKQIVIFQARQWHDDDDTIENILLEGFVIDDVTGERLPYATIVWNQMDESEYNGISDYTGFENYKGTLTNLQGYFRAQVPIRSYITLRISYVGYHPEEITLEKTENPHTPELSIRLQPTAYRGSEIVITESRRHTQMESQNHEVLSIGTFNPHGESNSIRMLQTLPSVGQGTALTEGAFVRGSRPDALQVLLDGSVIYNQSHLFGLVDSFNADAIRISRFYYDVTPARYQAPPGGTLHLITRTGSLHNFRGSAGMSNSAVSGNFEGPLARGQASWLVSGRVSIIDAIDWFNTGDMVAWGLDIDRKNSLSNDLFDFKSRIVTPGDFTAHFHDLHGKIFVEDRHNTRWVISGYSGYNDILQDADRLVTTATDQRNERFETRTFETANVWGNHSANLGMNRSVSGNWTLEGRSGFSYYHTRFLKEDFSYQRPGQTQPEHLLVIREFENESELTHWYAAFNLQYTPRNEYLESLWFGTEIHGYRSAYLEHSLNRAKYFLRTTPKLAELYGESDWNLTIPSFSAELPAEIRTGMRFQYYTDGSYPRLSPRIRTLLFPESVVSFGLGFSRTYQYLYKLSFYNQTTSDIWITATENQPPAEADHWSAGFYFRPWNRILFQVETFMKNQKNLRFHEIDIQSVQTPLSGAPWFSDNDGIARGLELLLRFSTEKIHFQQTYTLGKAELRNNRLNQGEWFYAQWDRRHRYNTLISLLVTSGLHLDVNWLYTTGVPDRLDMFDTDANRLGNYSRVDLSARYEWDRNQHKWTFQAGVYNLLNRQNPWYRDWIYAMESRPQRDRLIPVQADIYDLGIQPSFSVRYYMKWP